MSALTCHIAWPYCTGILHLKQLADTWNQIYIVMCRMSSDLIWALASGKRWFHTSIPVKGVIFICTSRRILSADASTFEADSE